MNATKIISLIILLNGCFPSFESTSKDKLFLKEINVESVKLEWFFYSTVSFETPDYITIEKERKLDTICVSNNIADLKLEDNKIKIAFYGSPEKNMKSISIPSNKMGYIILIDTSYILKTPKPRKFYKKDK